MSDILDSLTIEDLQEIRDGLNTGASCGSELDKLAGTPRVADETTEKWRHLANLIEKALQEKLREEDDAKRISKNLPRGDFD